MPFAYVLQIVNGPNSKYDGIAINPFGKVPCTLPKTYLDTVVNSTGYQNEFGQGAKKPADPNEPVKMLLGVPAPSEEVDAIRDALKTYGEATEAISSIHFMLKVNDSTKDTRYLILLGAEEAVAKEHFEAIYGVIKDIAKAVPRIEFNIRGKVPQMDKIADENEDKMLVYRA